MVGGGRAEGSSATEDRGPAASVVMPMEQHQTTHV